MTLIHTALLCEAQPIIETYKLTKVINKKEYKNEKILLIVSGIGEAKTSAVLQHILTTRPIQKAINIGIAGCKDKNIPIGSLFCANKKLKTIPHATITTVQSPTKEIFTTLVDMEASAFFFTCKDKNIDFFILKVVSDYLDDTIPKKSFVTKLIRDTLPQWKHLI